MRLQVQWVDMRGGYNESIEWETKVIDLDTDQVVGFVISERSPANRRISLFDGKYVAEFSDRHQCDAFAKGVAAVLNHMVAFTPQAATEADAA